ncbi:alpha-amylase family protein [Bacillus sp. UNC438CL73TsuS30]|uniref:alpha-amylase family protein n=1 Tax=Bacillus sp. UNC438CL73TsuS30 TaxID=1340434 RepID=UPI0004789D29|nr:beta-galactosidase trimerization domain-containing protein [Bacillus sp. UNC438CL73TsuS30]
MQDFNLRFRQIHLDFHTSPDIENIGAGFDPEEFAGTLEKAKVNSVTCFARCHHGYFYYDSQLFPEIVHPHLVNKNMLKEQIEACHKRNIRVPIYITVQWDDYSAEKHPEWLARDEKGEPIYHPNFYKEGASIEPGFYRHLCVNSPYRDYLRAQTQEILDIFPVDGLFFDIVNPLECSCENCQIGMAEAGLNPEKKEDRILYGQKVIDQFKLDMTAFIRESNQECSIFYNRGHISTAHRPIKSAYTHFELESLPSGDWGYLHFPITARYARNLGLDSLGMTGKFHTMWGDFHSFKNKAALEYECFRSLALNLKCMIGDQMEPNGEISKPVYDLIGSVYSQIEAKEPWCEGAKHLTEIGVFTPEEFLDSRSLDGLPPAIMGITRMLEEGGHQFDILDSESDLKKYKVLVLPDTIQVDEEFACKLENYLKNGGKLIASYQSGLDPDKKQFSLSSLGVELVGDAPYSPDFLLPKGGMGKGLLETEHVMYLKGLQVRALEGSEVLIDTKIPYFNRTFDKFCSHAHTPSSGETGYPGVVKKGQSIYFMHPIFSQYSENAPRWCKQLFLNALELLLPEPLIQHDGPSTLHVTINKQEDRGIIHLLHYIPERRSQQIEVIEDVIPLYNIKLSVHLPNTIAVIQSVPEGVSLDFVEKNGRIEFTLPKLNGHQMIELQYDK